MKGAIFRITKTILFGKYRIISTLGIGNSSTVYLAEHTKLNVYRAVKCIPKNTSLVTSLSLEASLLKNLNHPGIPVIYDIDEDESYYYLVEEYIKGESLDTFVSHQFISHELILKFCIQLCDILDYLHHLVPYPILYQDLKPEHIIVCGDQLKLIDFGIASFFTGSGKNYQIYGTKDFAAPEAVAGLPVSPSADIFGLGKLLSYLSTFTSQPCSDHFYAIIKKATASNAADRYETILLFQEALEKELQTACPDVSHLMKKISILGSKPGIGVTHIAISLVSILNHNGYTALYEEAHSTDSLHAMLRENPFIKEQDGICSFQFFRGIPDYGPAVILNRPYASVTVKDCGVFLKDTTIPDPDTLYLLVLSGSLWDMEVDIKAAGSFLSHPHVVFLCNFANHAAARKIAAKLGKTVYCFPFDPDVFSCTQEKEDLFFQILSIERRKLKFLHFIKRRFKNM